MKIFFTNPKLYFSMLLTASGLFLAGTASAQTFEITPSKTVTKSFPLTPGDHELYVYIENVSMNDIHLKWERLSDQFENKNWIYSICDTENCFDGIPASSEFPVTKPLEKEFLKLAVIITEESLSGKAEAKFLVYDVDNPSYKDTVTFTMDATSTSISGLNRTNNAINIYPNPATDVINIATPEIKTGNGNMSIFNALGAKVLDAALGSSELNTINVKAFPAGIYHIRLQDNAGAVITKSFIKE